MNEYRKSFTIIDSILNKEKADYILSMYMQKRRGKVALGHYLDGRACNYRHTYTYQTNDARILPKGTLYLTDVGMTGALNGVIGVKISLSIDS